jgi:hypothetical protein
MAVRVVDRLEAIDVDGQHCRVARARRGQALAERTLVAQPRQRVRCREVAQVRQRPEPLEAAPRLCGEQRQQVRDLRIRIFDCLADREQYTGDAVAITLDANRHRDQRTHAEVGQHLPPGRIELGRVAERVGRAEALGSHDEPAQLIGPERGDPLTKRRRVRVVDVHIQAVAVGQHDHLSREARHLPSRVQRQGEQLIVVAGAREPQRIAQQPLAARFGRRPAQLGDAIAQQAGDLLQGFRRVVDVYPVLPLRIERTDHLTVAVDDRHADFHHRVGAQRDVVSVVVGVGDDSCLSHGVHTTGDASTRGDAGVDVPRSGRRDAAEMIMHR